MSFINEMNARNQINQQNKPEEKHTYMNELNP